MVPAVEPEASIVTTLLLGLSVFLAIRLSVCAAYDTNVNERHTLAVIVLKVYCPCQHLYGVDHAAAEQARRHQGIATLSILQHCFICSLLIAWPDTMLILHDVGQPGGTVCCSCMLKKP